MSTHEKELAKLRSTIEEMERANLEPKSWTMIGEVCFYLHVLVETVDSEFRLLSSI
jgi:Mpp10 protein